MARIAAVQMNSGLDPARNLATAHEFVYEASQKKCDLVAFPENFLVFTEQPSRTVKLAQDLKGLYVQTIAEWAAQYDIWILAGSIPLKSGKKINNSTLLFSPEGKLIARYDKIHLFDVHVEGDRTYAESKTVSAGKKVVIKKTPLGVFGFSICYDLRFPELYRKLALSGSEIVFVPSAFTFKTGQAHWDVLTRARAIENQITIVAPAQWGTHENGRQTWGHSRMVDPWGRIIAERPQGIGLVIADIHLDDQKKIRAELPVLSHMRLKNL